MDKVTAVLLDIPKFTEWFGYCKEIKVVKSYSNFKKLVSRCVCTLVGENKVKVEYYVDGESGR